MKKLFLILLVLGLVFVAVVGFAVKNNAPAPVETPEPTDPDAPVVTIVPNEGETAAPSEDPSSEELTASMGRVDMEALYKLHPADAVYATVGDREISWGEYYEWLGTYILSAENYMDSMAAYGVPMGWDSEYADGVTLADYVTANLADNFHAYEGIARFAAQNGIEVTEEELAARRAEDMSAMLGPDADEAGWAEVLAGNFMTESIYLAQSRASLAINKALAEIYGENGEKISAAELQRYIEEKDYLRCNHILFLTMDMNTYESLDEDTILSKKAKAEEIAAELQAIEDRGELLARFAELKQELDEDSGKVLNPDGYLFTPGTMVPVFEDTTRALAEFEVSAPVLSDYGYHVIIRLPIEASDTLTDGGTLGAAAASEIMGADLDKVVDALNFELAPGMEKVNLLSFLTETSDK